MMVLLMLHIHEEWEWVGMAGEELFYFSVLEFFWIFFPYRLKKKFTPSRIRQAQRQPH